MMKLRPEVELALREATDKIADGIILKGDGGFRMHGTPRALLALVELGVRIGRDAERARWMDFISEAAEHGFSGWWPCETLGERDLEPWETFELRLFGREAGDTTEQNEVAGLILEAIDRTSSVATDILQAPPDSTTEGETR